MKIIGKIPKNLKFVYISCPITTGTLEVNVREACKISDKLMSSGFIPYNPATSVLQNIVAYKDYTVWMNYDFQLISLFKFVLRLPGKSKGGDAEVRYAIKNKIPVVILERRDEIENFIGMYAPAFKRGR
jgi:hypothetical protein